MTPIAIPRLSGVTSIAVTDCDIGRIGPSATPISNLAPRSNKNEVARPDKKEQRENTIVAIIKNIFLRPLRSDIAPNIKPDIAQVTDNAEAVRPICRFVKANSG
ncbi:hypothetical protein GCM10009022_29360 [Vreelandella titanicae]